MQRSLILPLHPLSRLRTDVLFPATLFARPYLFPSFSFILLRFGTWLGAFEFAPLL